MPLKQPERTPQKPAEPASTTKVYSKQVEKPAETEKTDEPKEQPQIEEPKATIEQTESKPETSADPEPSNDEHNGSKKNHINTDQSQNLASNSQASALVHGLDASKAPMAASSPFAATSPLEAS